MSAPVDYTVSLTYPGDYLFGVYVVLHGSLQVTTHSSVLLFTQSVIHLHTPHITDSGFDTTCPFSLFQFLIQFLAFSRVKFSEVKKIIQVVAFLKVKFSELKKIIQVVAFLKVKFSEFKKNYSVFSFLRVKFSEFGLAQFDVILLKCINCFYMQLFIFVYCTVITFVR